MLTLLSNPATNYRLLCLKIIKTRITLYRTARRIVVSGIQSHRADFQIAQIIIKIQSLGRGHPRSRRKKLQKRLILENLLITRQRQFKSFLTRIVI